MKSIFKITFFNIENIDLIYHIAFFTNFDIKKPYLLKKNSVKISL